MPYKELEFRFCLWQDFGDRLISAVVLDKTAYPLKKSDFPAKTDDLKAFGDLQVTTNYPYDGLEYISKDKNHDIHIMIQRNGSKKQLAYENKNKLIHKNHLVFINPENIGNAIDKIRDSPS